MANWIGLVLTNKGRALQAKVEAGITLALTKMKIGDGTISSGESLEALTDLVQPRQNISITSCTPLETGVCAVTGLITNANVTTGFSVRELGLYATDPDVGEILYAITTDSVPDYLQATGGATVISEQFTLNIAFSNTNTVTALIDSTVLATVDTVHTIVDKTMVKHEANNHIIASTMQPTTGENVWLQLEE
jgi:hypothetical protein